MVTIKKETENFLKVHYESGSEKLVAEYLCKNFKEYVFLKPGSFVAEIPSGSPLRFMGVGEVEML